MDSSYNLRSKFKLQLEKLELSENYFDECFDIAIVMSSNELLRKLWNMSFPETEEESLNQFRLSTEEQESVEFKFIPKELVVSLKNEIRWQYTVNINREFLIPKFEYSKQDEIYTQFFKKLGNNQILSFGILKLILNFLGKGVDTSIIEKTIWLLKSPKSNNQYGGLKNIGLRHAEAIYFQNKSEDIGIFLSEYYQTLIEKEGAVGMNTENEYYELKNSTSSPFANLKEELKAKGFELSDSPDTPKNQEISENTTDVGSSSSQDSTSGDKNFEEVGKVKNLEVPIAVPPELDLIIKNPDLVDDFLRIYDEVTMVGLDVEYLIRKRDSITHFLDSYFKLLEDACGYL